MDVNQWDKDIPIALPPQPVRFLDRFRAFMRARNLSYSTEKTYVYWVLNYIRFHGRRHPEQLSSSEVMGFLSHLAVQRHCSPATQKVALNALVFLYREFLGKPLESLEFVRSQRQPRVPVVFSHAEAMAIIARLDGINQLVARLIYGTGMRINEVLRLRVKDVDFAMQQLTVRAGKGGKDRVTLLPDALIEPLRQQIEVALTLHQQDVAQGLGEAYMPFALARKYKGQARAPAWQYVFAAPQFRHALAGVRLRHSHYPKTARPRGCEDHGNLHPCGEERWFWCGQSVGSVMQASGTLVGKKGSRQHETMVIHGGRHEHRSIG